MKKIRTHYSNLQVVEDASIEVIKGAYKHLSQKYHPDRNPDDRDRCEEIMRILNEAYRVLTDPVLRKEHDDWISWNRSKEEESFQGNERHIRDTGGSDYDNKTENDPTNNINRNGEDRQRLGGNRTFVNVVIPVLMVFFALILAATVPPAYHDYTIRKKVAEGIAAANSLKDKVETYTINNRAWPSHISDVQDEQINSLRNNYKLGVGDNGVIYVFFVDDSGVQRKGLAFFPSATEQGHIVWKCQSIDVSDRHLPANCRYLN